MVCLEERVHQHSSLHTACANTEYLSVEDRGFIPMLLNLVAITYLQAAQILCSAGSSTLTWHMAQPAALLLAHTAKCGFCVNYNLEALPHNTAAHDSHRVLNNVTMRALPIPVLEVAKKETSSCQGGSSDTRHPTRVQCIRNPGMNRSIFEELKQNQL